MTFKAPVALPGRLFRGLEAPLRNWTNGAALSRVSAVGRIPKWLAVILAMLVVGIVWHVGTRGMDFLTPPTAAQLEMARTRASQQLAKPSNLFAVHSGPSSQNASGQPEPRDQVPATVEAPPRIEFGQLTGEPELDAWFELSGLPAASFIDLASRLEADTRMTWARVAWERVIDRSEADEDQMQAALKGVLRTRLAPTPAPSPPVPGMQLLVKVPEDRIELSKRAAEQAALELTSASSDLVQFEAKVAAVDELEEELEIAIGRADSFSAIRIRAPEVPTNYSEAMLMSVFRLVASQLATNPELSAVVMPVPGEKAKQALGTRITRKAWLSFASAYADP